MPNDLFTTENYEDHYRKLHEQDWANTNRILEERGEFGTWVECDILLNKDQHRLLSIVSENFGYLMHDEAVVDRGMSEAALLGDIPMQRKVKRLTVDAGFLADVNMQFTLNTCLSEGWLEEVWNAEHQCKQLRLTHKGRWVLDAYEADIYWETLDD